MTKITYHYPHNVTIALRQKRCLHKSNERKTERYFGYIALQKVEARAIAIFDKIDNRVGKHGALGKGREGPTSIRCLLGGGYKPRNMLY